MTKKVNLLPNTEPDLSTLNLADYYASYKLDGIRATTQDGQLVSRSLKPIPNARVQAKFKPLTTLEYILDGELYEHGATFQSITSRVMSHDVNPFGLKFYLFDIVAEGKTFTQRQAICMRIAQQYPDLIQCVGQVQCTELETMWDVAMEKGYEGLIIKHRDGLYKNGRSTAKEATGFKLKPYVTFDSEILSVIEQTEVKAGVAKKTNELGRSETSKKKGDRQPAGTASAFLVKYGNTSVKVSLASMSHFERQEAWDSRADLIGNTIEYKGLLVGSKNVPRHPVYIRMRLDRD